MTPLTTEQRADIAERLNKTFKMPCGGCGRREFRLEGLGRIDHFNLDRTVIIGGATFPTVLVACTHCGLVLQFSAIHLGVVPSEPAQQ